MRKSYPARSIFLAIAITSATVALLPFAFLRHDRILFEKAIRITPPGQRILSHYVWLSTSEILLDRWTGPHSVESCVLDTRNGKIKDPNAYFQRHRSLLSEEMLTLQIAHDQRDYDLQLLIQNRMTLSHPSPSENRRLQSIRAHLPKESQLQSLAISSNGNCIAYFLWFTRLSPLDYGLHRLLPHWKTHPKRILALYRSGRDGNHMQEIAWQPISETSKSIGANPYDFRWAPDQKHVSFGYRDALWEVSLAP